MQISDTDTVSLTEMPTIIYGAENRFVIDLGTKRSFDISCKRVNPRSYVDNKNGDKEKWSNGYWWKWFISVIDEWQCTMTSSTYPEGGFKLELESGDTSLFPNIDANVYISGSISPSFGVDVLSFTVPLTVARLTTTGSSTRTATIRYEYGSYYREVAVPVNVAYTLDSADSDWAPNSAYLFSCWEDGDKIQYQAGESVTLMSEDETLTLTAVWSVGIPRLFSSAGSDTCTVPDGCTKMIAYIVGGGGGAGGRGDTDNTLDIAGGAGGGGEVKIKTFWVEPGSTISYTVGEGGRCGLNHQSGAEASDSQGKDGGESSISFTDSNDLEQKLTAAGGLGGDYGLDYNSINPYVSVDIVSDGVWAVDWKSDAPSSSEDDFELFEELVVNGYDLCCPYILIDSIVNSGQYISTVYYSSAKGGTSYAAGGSSTGYANAVGENNSDGSASEPECDEDYIVTLRFSDGTEVDGVRMKCTATAGPSGGVPDVTLVTTDDDGNCVSVTPSGGIGVLDSGEGNSDMDGKYGGGGGASPGGKGPGFYRDVYTQGDGGDGAVCLVFFEE